MSLERQSHTHRGASRIGPDQPNAGTQVIRGAASGSVCTSVADPRATAQDIRPATGSASRHSESPNPEWGAPPPGAGQSETDSRGEP